MTCIKFVLADGSEHEITAGEGDVIMKLAMREGFSGILAECGGVCSCATCHVHIDPAWIDRLPAREELETEMLDFAEGVDEYSRLSCQLKVTPELDGLIVHVPESQY